MGGADATSPRVYKDNNNSHCIHASRPRYVYGCTMCLWVGVVLVRVSQYEDDGVASEKHLADETVFVHRLRLLTLTRLRHLRPHLLHVLENP